MRHREAEQIPAMGEAGDLPPAIGQQLVKPRRAAGDIEKDAAGSPSVMKIRPGLAMPPTAVSPRRLRARSGRHRKHSARAPDRSRREAGRKGLPGQRNNPGRRSLIVPDLIHLRLF